MKREPMYAQYLYQKKSKVIVPANLCHQVLKIQIVLIFFSEYFLKCFYYQH